MKKALITAFATTLQISCAIAGVPLRFDADVRSTSTFQASAYRGETLDIRARLLDGAHPLPVPAGATAGLWWKTNGMDRYWGPAPATVSTNGVVSASWAPTNDVGAASYRGFLGVSLSGDGSNLTYAANFTLRMLESPGFAPNSLPLPVQSIDFSLIEVSNAPWIEEESDPTVPAWAKAETPPLTEESDPVFAAWVETNDIPAIRLGNFGVRTPDSPEHVLRARMNPHLKIEAQGWTNYFPNSDAVAGKLIEHQRLATQDATNLAKHAAMAIRDQVEHGWTSEWSVASDAPEGERLDLLVEWRAGEWGYRGEIGGYERFWFTGVADIDATFLEMMVSDPITGLPGHTYTATRHFVTGLDGYARLADLGSAAYADADDYATPSDVATEVAAASNALGRAWSADSVLLSMLLQGSNVVAEVTNYNSQVRSPSLRLLQLNASNEYDVVWSELTNLSKVAQDASDHADAVAAAALNTSTNYAAPRAWSGTTSGLGAEAPAGWTWISTPNLAIGGGLEFEKHATSGGAVWVLRNNGMVAQMNALTNNTAYLEISSLDGESVFRIEKTDAQTLGVNTARVSVDGSTLICGVDVVSASPPLVRLKTSLSQGEWVREEDGIPPSLADVQWEGESGAWVCRITNNSGGHSLFATMAVIQEGGTKIVPAAPMDAGAGILCTDGHTRIRPVNNNGAITWEIIQ